MPIYFHETLDPVREPGAHTRFLQELGEIVHTQGNAEGSAGSRCVALWAPIFLTGEWPRMIGFWEMTGGWEEFAAHFDSHKDLFHKPLERWYGERSGGFDRVLVPTDYTATLDQLLNSGTSAPVVLQQTIELRPGDATEYLKRFGDVASAIGQGEPFSVLGAYEVAFRNASEVILLWSFPDVATVARTQSDPSAFPALAAWLAQSREHELRHRGLVVRPTWWSPLH